jgi:hypothetical protein
LVGLYVCIYGMIGLVYSGLWVCRLHLFGVIERGWLGLLMTVGEMVGCSGRDERKIVAVRDEVLVVVFLWFASDGEDVGGLERFVVEIGLMG